MIVYSLVLILIIAVQTLIIVWLVEKHEDLRDRIGVLERNSNHTLGEIDDLSQTQALHEAALVDALKALIKAGVISPVQRP